MTYRFGPFSLEPRTRQLLRDGREVPLSPKAFQLLLLLIERRDRALSKQDLHQHLWPSTFVLETNLASLVAEVRRALNDAPARPAFVRTMHRFGYRFIGDLLVDDDPGEGTGRVNSWLVWETRQVSLSEGESIVGRGADASVWLDAPGVSRHHARIVIRNGDATVEDSVVKPSTTTA